MNQGGGWLELEAWALGHWDIWVMGRWEIVTLGCWSSSDQLNKLFLLGLLLSSLSRLHCDAVSDRPATKRPLYLEFYVH